LIIDIIDNRNAYNHYVIRIPKIGQLLVNEIDNMGGFEFLEGINWRNLREMVVLNDSKLGSIFNGRIFPWFPYFYKLRAEHQAQN
jgi:hypothetical protein